MKYLTILLFFLFTFNLSAQYENGGVIATEQVDHVTYIYFSELPENHLPLLDPAFEFDAVRVIWFIQGLYGCENRFDTLGVTDTLKLRMDKGHVYAHTVYYKDGCAINVLASKPRVIVGVPYADDEGNCYCYYDPIPKYIYAEWTEGGQILFSGGNAVILILELPYWIPVLSIDVMGEYERLIDVTEENGGVALPQPLSAYITQVTYQKPYHTIFL